MTPNTIKVRDDQIPLKFSRLTDNNFKLETGFEAPWTNNGEFSLKELRNRIEPWLTSLFQAEHLAILAGSGLTHAIHHLAAGKPATGMANLNIKNYKDEITEAAKKSSSKAGRQEGNLEDQFRVANELLIGLKILNKTEEAEKLSCELKQAMKFFAKSILESEAGIANATNSNRENAFNTLVTFLMSFASRNVSRDRLNIFTTNYDRVIEAGAELAGIHLLDRFLGNLMPIFRTSRLDLDLHYSTPGIRGEPRYLEGVARITKLHGSIDWVQTNADIRRIGIPFGSDDIESFLKAPGLNDASAHELMIYPNAAKDRETANYPYIELFRDLAASICRPNNTLVTYGYSFGDEHINRVIRDMLTIPSTHLVIISRDDNLGRIMKTYEQLGRPSQISLLIGTDLSDIKTLTEYFLPKSSIDKTTFRMADLLKQRYGPKQDAIKPSDI